MHFCLENNYYEGKRVLDVGCGPRGSLEWANMTACRVGLDPLSDEYRKLGTDKHMMEYVNACSENMPFSDGEFDVVSSFNSLDHVDSVSLTIGEIKRVTKLGGLFLLLVVVNHLPTECEPHLLTPEGLMKALKPSFFCDRLILYRPDPKGIYDSAWNDERFPITEMVTDLAHMSARFIKIR